VDQSPCTGLVASAVSCGPQHGMMSNDVLCEFLICKIFSPGQEASAEDRWLKMEWSGGHPQLPWGEGGNTLQ
jgi:hypothetical protein